ncbi:uracil phosphoribosyltransferase [Stakelama tenebrarum]|uniref:Uracil phosphoribosyltransferase n=1 Tax=Stakelama tenebrarum TaxID=2711215 RepID=A0A6G6Y418_9SPHN|nr:uracil phosphoribosyltransferase [Sphingosinithalassobacter tenebrarum]QIG79639.1 uracil phosphoribosyltransferase [Sphingosinithalassobacter tenebrarum]
MDHILAQHKLTLLRDQRLSSAVYRQLMTEIGYILCNYVTSDIELIKGEYEFDAASGLKGPYVDQKSIVIVPILRAGLGLANAFQSLIPNCMSGHIGLVRDHEKNRVNIYMHSIPVGENLHYIILDPVVHSTQSIQAACRIIEERFLHEGMRLSFEKIRVASVICHEQGVANFFKMDHFKGVKIFTVGADTEEDKENPNFLYPGIGDAGDRIFGLS